MAGRWEENKHPRDNDGKFSEKSGSSAQTDYETAVARQTLEDKGIKTKNLSADEISKKKDIETGKTGRYSVIDLKDEYIPLSLGAKNKNYDIAYGDKVVHLQEGTYIRDKEIIAGKGKKREIDDINRLVREHGGDPKKWVKVKGKGTILLDGKEQEIEIHWYEEPSVGKVELKRKKDL